MSLVRKANQDALIDETMAFVATIRPVADVNQPPQTTKFIDRERDAIKQRVGSFKAHQQRLIRERQAFANAALKKIRPANTR